MNNETDFILELLRGDGSFTTNKKLVQAIGLVEATLLCEIISYYFYIKKKERDKLSENQIYIDSDGWFEFSKKYCQETLNIKKCTLNSALVKLETSEMIHTKIKGSPARNFIKIDDNLPSKLALLLSNIQFAENSKLECRKQQTLIETILIIILLLKINKKRFQKKLKKRCNQNGRLKPMRNS